MPPSPKCEACLRRRSFRQWLSNELFLWQRLETCGSMFPCGCWFYPNRLPAKLQINWGAVLASPPVAMTENALTKAIGGRKGSVQLDVYDAVSPSRPRSQGSRSLKQLAMSREERMQAALSRLASFCPDQGLIRRGGWSRPQSRWVFPTSTSLSANLQ